MSLSTTFSTLNNLAEISFIAGTSYTIKFTVKDQNGNAVDLSSATCRWFLAPYGTDFTVLRKTGSVIATNVFSVLLGATDTANLSGKFTHQASVTFSNGLVIYPAQGVITIIKGLT